MKRSRTFAITLLAMILVFAATSAHAQYSVLYSFGGSGGVDAAGPFGVIAQGEDGSLYSTGDIGGANNEGAVWKITTAGKEKLLYSFCSLANCADGNSPNGGLTLRPDGHFIGTTVYNAAAEGESSGTIFDVSPTGSLTTLYSFTGGADGSFPLSSPILGPDGEFYGMADFGGANGDCGTVYRLSSIFQVIHTFNNLATGCEPEYGLTLGTNGSFYGTTYGGTDDAGNIFKLTYRPSQSTLYSVLANFSSTNGYPKGALVESNDGNFYGITQEVIFQITPGGVLTFLHTLNGTSDGAYPNGGLTLASDGNFYGTTSNAGTNGEGTLFQVTPGGTFTVLYNFGTVANDGYNAANLVQHTNGLLYGITQSGGARTNGVYNCGYDPNFGCGVVFSWNGNLPPFVSTVQLMGAVGSTVEILGQGFTSSSTVSFNGVAATATIQSGTSLFAIVPSGATTGSVTVTTSTGTLTSNRQFVVLP